MMTFDKPSEYYQDLSRLRKIPLVLVVDDDPDNLFFIACIIDALNLKCICAQTGGSAIELAINHQPDLILLDMVMPEIDGMEITRRLKNNSFSYNIPILAVTGLTFPKHKEAMKKAGCDDYISKPCSIDELELKISYFLNLCLI
ncbi:response regulator [Waterburya agarophytonicola K14]|uniref:Response regulator n=1 Tax=Waterburya agarophytonicola KI4 TaxID=2874699 RepID=A0A964FIL3_9CYAN|nr:response regulator [Waterburya agarophytonicola]MCC0178258.1 response regulator [Waterburya agarophytonicola KI4]